MKNLKSKNVNYVWSISRIDNLNYKLVLNKIQQTNVVEFGIVNVSKESKEFVIDIVQTEIPQLTITEISEIFTADWNNISEVFSMLDTEYLNNKSNAVKKFDYRTTIKYIPVSDMCLHTLKDYIKAEIRLMKPEARNWKYMRIDDLEFSKVNDKEIFIKCVVTKPVF